jgi:hypothetical protein
VLKLKRPLRHLPILTLALGALMALPDTSAAAPKRNQSSDICVVTRDSNDKVYMTLVFHDVPPLSPGRAVPLWGLSFNNTTNIDQRAFPFDGSALMENDGTIRLGVFIHTMARRSTLFAGDHHLAGKTDATFSGTLHYKIDGEVYPYYQFTFEPEDCAAITIP